jgi:hypothetical protein
MGENLYKSTGSAGCGDASESWYAEVNDYIPNTPVGEEQAMVGHYTQMMWRSTEKLGCGSANGGEWNYVVCRYFPAGNMMGTAVEDS